MLRTASALLGESNNALVQSVLVAWREFMLTSRSERAVENLKRQMEHQAHSVVHQLTRPVQWRLQ